MYTNLCVRCNEQMLGVVICYAPHVSTLLNRLSEMSADKK